MTTVAAMLEDALREIAGPNVQPTSMTIDYGSPAPASPLKARAWIERSTRSLIFAQAEVRAEEGGPIAIASAVFRRPTAVQP